MDIPWSANEFIAKSIKYTHKWWTHEAQGPVKIMEVLMTQTGQLMARAGAEAGAWRLEHQSTAAPLHDGWVAVPVPGRWRRSDGAPNLSWCLW